MKEIEFQKERRRERKGKKERRRRRKKREEGEGRPVLVNNPGASRLLGYLTS